MSTSWRGEPARTGRGGRGLTISVATRRAGKIVSLTDRTGTEWLLQPAGGLPEPASPGDVFTEAEMCGWDECAPTISPCELDGGEELPDHGDLWTATWRYDGLDATAQGWSLPYVFHRRIAATATGLRLDYRVEATDRTIPFLWAAHPQFQAPSGTRVELPGTVDAVVDVLAPQPRRLGWPDSADDVGQVTPGGYRKVYVDPDTSVSSATLVRPDGRRLVLSWDPSAVPYLGIWVDRGALAHSDVIALEPSTGYYDSLQRAVQLGRVAVVQPGRPLRWHLDLAVEDPV